MKKILSNWPRLVFIFVPLLIGVVDAAVLISEQLESETAKAIRLVRESESRKENFTVQQYLYATLYHRKSEGEAVEIEGWRAEPSTDLPGAITVEFNYADETGRHVALWQVDLKEEKVVPRSADASYLSWQ
jgi:hypothetical protein